MKLYESQIQGHSLTLVQDHSESTFSTSFPETTGPIKAKFHVEPQWDGGTKVSLNGLGHMTKMAAMPIYGKTWKILHLWNLKADDLECFLCSIGYSSTTKFF